MVVLPADHMIEHVDNFLYGLTLACDFASENPKALLTLGMKPDSPHTGYGYISISEENAPLFSIHPVTRFLEKPNLENARRLSSQKNVYWNSGVFIWSLQALEAAFEEFLNPPWDHVKKHIQDSDPETNTWYASLPKVPIDTAVLERSSDVYTVPLDIGWSDIGSFESLYQWCRSRPQMSKGSGISHLEENIVLQGDVFLNGSHRSLIYGTQGKPVVLLDVNDLIVIDTEEGLLVASRSSDQKVKDAVLAIKEKKMARNSEIDP